MCGITGYFNSAGSREVNEKTIQDMTAKLIHRGPDAEGYYGDEHIQLGFRRLSFLDLKNGNQPIFNEDRSIVSICNGEIYNYEELKESLVKKGHRFDTQVDVEVLPHLYEEYGVDFMNQLNGQFAFVIYDKKKRRLFAARDQMGINPFYYTVVNQTFIFASEIKGILAHPFVTSRLDFAGLDLIFSFPGLVSPRTMFKDINSLKPGHYILVSDEGIKVQEYWDLIYPKIGEIHYDKTEKYYKERLEEILYQSVKYRLHADVPIGFYLSGGLDSSLIGAMIQRADPKGMRHSFSIAFRDPNLDESRYQKLLADHIRSVHHEILFDRSDVINSIEDAIYYSECPLKETFNTAVLAISKTAKSLGVSALLSGEGADELFAGYVGYRFDQLAKLKNNKTVNKISANSDLEDQYRRELWGDTAIFYEKNLTTLHYLKKNIYSDTLKNELNNIERQNYDLINKERLKSRDIVHQRSYLDVKLRLSDHLISDHGDRMGLANSVENRYPYLDYDLIEFVREIPPSLKIKDLVEKYILRKTAHKYLPREICTREKYGFNAPSSYYLLNGNNKLRIQGLLDRDKIKSEGIFDPDEVGKLIKRYESGYKPNVPYEDDILLILITFEMFIEIFKVKI